MSWPHTHFLTTLTDVKVTIMTFQSKTYKWGDQGHSTAKDDEERLDADVMLQRAPGVNALIMIYVVTFSLRFDLFLPASPSLSCSWTCHACPSSRGGRWPSSAWTGASCSTGEGWLTVCLVQFRFGRLHFLPWRDRICLIFTGLFLSGFVGVFAEKPWSPTKIVEPTRLRESWGTN